MVWQTPNLFLPNSPLIVIWEITFSLLVTTYFSLSLFFIAFRIPREDKFVNGFLTTLVILLICVIDSLISINTSFIRNGKLITSHKVNIKKYTKSWLIISDAIVILILALRLMLLAAENANQDHL